MNGGIAPNFITKHLSFNVQAARLVPQCDYGFAIFMINISINNHPLEKFKNEDREMVVILVGACGTKQDVHGT